MAKWKDAGETPAVQRESGFDLFGKGIHEDGEKEDAAEDDVLPKSREAEEVDSDREDADEKDADEGANDCALPPEEACAADDDGGDDLEFPFVAGLGIAGAEGGGLDDSGKAAEGTGDGIDEEFDFLDVDAGEAGGFFISPDGVDLSAEDGPREKHMKEDDSGEHDDAAEGDSGKPFQAEKSFSQDAATEEGESLVFDGDFDRFLAADDEGKTAADEHHGQCGDERRDAEAGDDKTGDASAGKSDEDAGEDGDDEGEIEGESRADGESHGAEDASDADEGADGEVNSGGDDDRGHAEGDEHLDGHLAEDVGSVLRADEGEVGLHGEDDNEGNEKHPEAMGFNESSEFHFAL